MVFGAKALNHFPAIYDGLKADQFFLPSRSPAVPGAAHRLPPPSPRILLHKEMQFQVFSFTIIIRVLLILNLYFTDWSYGSNMKLKLRIMKYE